ncbi:HAD family phosphatase [candidate division KSB1 bacterium]|nr:HAD family phosphatase [candidate division KSB1 bacterium]
MIEAVFFDFDGVIARTLPYHLHAWQIALKPLKLRLKISEIAVEEGARAREIIKKIFSDKQIVMDDHEIDQLVKRKRQIYQQTSKSAMYPEVPEFLNWIKQNVPKIALVTGAVIADIRKAVNDDLLDHFDLIITSEDVTHAKPDPEPYLAAASKLNIVPQHCLVFENAPLGIRSAKQAGMKVIALRTTIRDEKVLGDADYIVTGLRDIRLNDILQDLI